MDILGGGVRYAAHHLDLGIAHGEPSTALHKHSLARSFIRQILVEGCHALSPS